MNLTRNGLLSLVCVGGAFACGLVANAAIDLVMPMPAQVAAEAPALAKLAEAAAPQPATAYSLASVTSSPAEITPIKVRTVLIQYGEPRSEIAAAPAPAPTSQRAAAVPLPRPRPASAPMIAMSMADATGSVERDPGSLAISAATRKGAPDDGEVLGAAGIERMKMALALTAEQEEYWPAIAAELRALGRVLSQQGHGKAHAARISVDDETIQRLYWAAAPLISRLSYEQKLKVKQMANVMGLHQVAQAL